MHPYNSILTHRPRILCYDGRNIGIMVNIIMAQESKSGDHTHDGNPFTIALNKMLQDKAARPEDVYRLAVIVQGLIDSLDDPPALDTIRFELRALINDLSQKTSGD